VKVEHALFYGLGCGLPFEVANVIFIGRVHGPGRQLNATVRNYKRLLFSCLSFAVRRAEQGVVDITKLFYRVINLFGDSWRGELADEKR